MRTTVTLDPDVEQALRSAMRERGLSFKEALNEAIRAGLMGRTKQNMHGFSQPTFRLGRELAADDALEDEELTRKLSIRN